MNELSTQLAFWGVTVHLFVDWFLQNHWMATNKSSLNHPAAWVHSGLHFVGLLLVFPIQYAALIAIIHLIIDTRVPLAAWRVIFKQTREGDVALHVAIWGDQVAHWVVICIVALWVARL